MKHKTELRKGLAQVALSAPVASGTPITRDGKPVGNVLSVSGTQALAYVRFDRAGEGMQAGKNRPCAQQKKPRLRPGLASLGCIILCRAK